jgi:branched-chain amino acid transport system permease protein
MSEVAQTVFDGLLFGATYSLVGVGFTLIFGVMRKLNMSYVSGSIAAAYVSLIVAKHLLHGTPAPLIVPITCVVGALTGVAIYLACFRYISSSLENASLMATIGMMLLLDELVAHATNGMPQSFPSIFPDSILEIGPLSLRTDLGFVFLLCLAAMGALLTIVYRTRFGVALRAVAQQSTAARLCGVRIDRVNAWMFALTGALGGVAGALVCSAVGTLSIILVQPLTVKGLIATVIGGLGNVPGAIVAGLLLGGLENGFQHFRGVTERDLWVMILLFAVLTFRPHGLFTRVSTRD